MTWNEIVIFVKEYYPIAIAGIITVATFAGSIFAIYTKVSGVVKPLYDKIKNVEDTNEVNQLLSNKLENIKLSVMKTDLIAKLSNPTLGDDVKASYQAQLDQLVALNPLTEQDKNAIADAVEEAKKYL